MSEHANSDHIEQAIVAADAILERIGTADPDLRFMVASFAIGNTLLTDVSDDAIPIVTLHKPIESFAQEASYRLTITYGVQSSGESRHILVPGADKTPRVSSYGEDRFIDRAITRREEAELAKDLSKTAAGL